MHRLVALGCLLAAACGRPEEPAPSAPASEAPPEQSFARHGAPGPWWRAGAMKSDFDAESRVCLSASNEARRQTVPDEKSAAAYRAFLDCMEGRGWHRGLRPARLTSPAR